MPKIESWYNKWHHDSPDIWWYSSKVGHGSISWLGDNYFWYILLREPTDGNRFASVGSLAQGTTNTLQEAMDAVESTMELID